ncbi:hypothetical protein [Chryseobacterium arthrosphaerae]|uniref:hypothetical protein n=1 Tax=Chryseobacterium arthrosphaerae TaxID=651561 RepID=UPI00241BE640|nr:hypothetical protein [Chryseobacterium arthrosphaerae]
MSVNKFAPVSHFFVDHTNLSEPVATNLAADAFGPVSGNESNQYRTTSVVRSTATSKVFAICDSHILIQPNKDDAAKVNIILKPTASYSPFKIKYFIYRGVNKSDILNGNKLVPSTSAAPDFIKRIWAVNLAISTALNLPMPADIDGKVVGYDPGQPDTILLDSLFFKSESEINFPKCTKGELLGNFTGKIGLDIVFDKGDYHLDYEEELFSFNLGFVRSYDHILNATSISNPVKKKKFREYIHQFIDASAFWGAHASRGKLSFYNNPTPQNSGSTIYNSAVRYYQTRYKMYFYLLAERGRSYNFYGYYPSGKVSLTLDGQPRNLIDYQNHDWPILIHQFQQPVGTTPINKFGLSFEYKIDNKTFPKDLNIYTYTNFPFLASESFTRVNDLVNVIIDASGNNILQYTDQSQSINGYFSNIGDATFNNSISAFFVCHIKGYQKFPSENYFNDLWTFNTKDIIEGTGTTTNKSHFLNRYNLLDLQSIVKFRNIVAQQKVYSDYGKNAAGTAKKRKLYITSITDTRGGEGKSYLNGNAFNVSTVSEGIKSIEEFTSFLFNDKDYTVYKGKINDGSSDIPTLSLVHTTNNDLKQKFLLLGITEEEYNKLLYDNPAVPATPPATPHISKDFSNISIHLNEVSVSPATKSYRKYNAGLKFENAAGNLDIKYPSSSNVVEIYSTDGFFFFSKQYAEYQEFYLQMSDNEVHFRPLTTWQGEFGFDWIRIGDSGLSGDSLTPNNRRTVENVGHYYISATSDEKEQGDTSSTNFRTDKTEFHSLSKEYFSYPRQVGQESMYVAPWLAVYPSKDSAGNPTPFPKTNAEGNPKCLTKVRLNLIFNLASPSSISVLKLKYEKKHFQIGSVNASATTALPDTTDALGNVFSNLKINNSSAGAFPASLEIEITGINEFSDVKSIQCFSTSGGTEKLAGELRVLPNSKVNRYEIKALLVNCVTNKDTASPNQTGFETTSPFTVRNKILSELNKTFSQALIDIKSYRTVSLDLRRSVTPAFYTQFDTLPAAYYLHPRVQHTFLKSLLTGTSTPAADEIIFYCINEYCADPIPGSTSINILNGETAISDNLMFFPEIVLYRSGLHQSTLPAVSNDDNTIGHESMHGLGLFHTFSNFNHYTSKRFITDNILDYSSPGVSPTTGYRTSTSKYQWYVLQNNKIITKEI